MLYLYLVTGEHGCGIVGTNLAKALSELTPVERVDDTAPPGAVLPGTLFERMRRTFKPSFPARRHIAYSVFEDDLAVRRRVPELMKRFDMLIPASRWCESVLRDGGMTEVALVPQGIDTGLFHPTDVPRRRWRERFVVFSGGKFEFRKGQDVVARAFRNFAERHDDALLVAAWHNPWPHIAANMFNSPHCSFQLRNAENLQAGLERWLVAVGLRLEQVVLLPKTPHAEMAGIYRDTDIGLFPNRCEGGTNLVMMEYMAVGRPVIATDFSGHRDVLTETNSLRLRHLTLLPIVERREMTSCWCEPDVDEVVAHLEVAYQERERMNALGRQAAAHLSSWTWQRSARSILSACSVTV